jgi:hypothetical protein
MATLPQSHQDAPAKRCCSFIIARDDAYELPQHAAEVASIFPGLMTPSVSLSVPLHVPQSVSLSVRALASCNSMAMQYMPSSTTACHLQL